MNLATAPPQNLSPLALDEPALRDKLLRHAMIRLRHRETAEDAVQEAFTRAVKRQSTFDPAVGPLIGWLFGILNLVIREERRKLQRQPIQPPVDFRDWDRAAAKLDPRGDPSELAELLAQLPEPSRRIVTMHHLEGVSHQEIGAALGISVGNSRVKLGRVMEELKHLAEKEGAR